MRHYLSSTLLLLAVGLTANFPAVPLNAGDAPPPATAEPTQPAQSAQPAWTMPEAERQALHAVVEQAIAAGLPDAKGGTFLHGNVSYQVQIKAGGSVHTQDHQSEGLHLRLADGRLLLNLRWPVPTTGEGAVDISKLEAITPDKLFELGAKHPNLQYWKTEDMEAQLARYFAPSEIPKLRAVFAIRELLVLAQGEGNDSAIPALMLLRMQVPKAELVAVGASLNVLWNEIGQDFFAGKPVRLNLAPIDQNAIWRERANQMEKQRGLVLPPADIALRQGAIGWCFSSLYGGEQERWQRPGTTQNLTPAQAGQAISKLTAAGDPGAAAFAALVAAFEERAAISADITLDADLATVLRWWDEGGQQQNSHQEGQNVADLIKQIEHLPAEHRSALIAQVAVMRLDEAPIGDLMALAGDQRVSRWVDQHRVRTVGDNALRALTLRLGCDPRALIGRDVTKLWDAEERAATVQALQTWWQANQKKPLAELLAAALGKMALPDIARLVGKANEAERTRLLTDLAKLWQATPPKDPDPVSLGYLLAAARIGKQLDAVVGAWPVTGRQRTLLAAWHQERGDGSHVDVLLTETLKTPAKAAPKNSGDAEAENDAAEDVAVDGFGNAFSGVSLRNSLRIVAHTPTVERLNRLLVAVGTPAAGEDGAHHFGAVTALSWGMQDELSAWWGEDRMRHGGKADPVRRARAAIPLVLFGLMVKDQRPAPDHLIAQYAQWGRFNDDGEEKKEERKPATDLRLADLAGVVFSGASWNLALDDLIGREANEQIRALRVDLTAPKAERDAVLGKIRVLIATALPLALKAANLPTAIPGVTDVAPAAGGEDAPVF